MKAISAPLVAALCVTGFLAWLASGTRESTDDLSAGALEARRPSDYGEPSEDPPPACARPIPLRLVEPPPWFGLSAVDARTAMATAMSLWEEPIGRQLFVIDSARGIPVRFVYDGRQARTRERIRMEGDLGRVDRELQVGGRALEAARQEYDLAQLGYRQRVEELQEERSTLNATIRRWNDGGGAPAAVAEELRDVGEALQARVRSFEEQARELEDVERRLREEEQRLAGLLDDRNRAAEELERRFPPIPVETGAYLETRLTEGEAQTPLMSEVRVFRFEDLNDLVWILSHELGHVLGLGHAAVPTAVMSAEYGPEIRPQGPVTIHTEDARLLRDHCSDVLG